MLNQYFIYYFLFSFSILLAQSEKVTISGLIKDSSTGDPIIGANIMLYQDSIATTKVAFKGTSSNRYGFYVIPKIKKGEYVIVFSSLGYETKNEVVNITIVEGTLSLNIEMKQKDLELNEIVVQDKKTEDVALSTVDISPKLLQMLPSFSGEIDIFKTLQMIPGVKVASDLSNGLYVRGGSPDQNLTLVDGMVIYNPAHLGNIASSFNSNAVHDIRLIKGAYPAEYGGRLSSVLDIKLRGGTKEKEQGTFGLGTIISHITLEGPFSEKATYMFSSRVMYYDFYQKKFSDGSTTPRYNFLDFSGKINYNITDDEVISVSGNFNSDHIYSPENMEDFNYDIKWHNNSISLNWLNVTEKSLLINGNVSYINYGTKTTLDDVKNDSLANDYFASSELHDLLTQAKFEYKWNDSHRLKAGFEYSMHFYNLNNRDFYDPVLEVAPDYSEKFILSEAALFVQDEWSLLPTLNTNLGLRFYYVKESDSFLFEPRLSASFAITPNFLLKGAYAVSNQFLHLIIRNDITLPTDLWFPSTKNTSPSKSEQFVTGFDSYFFNKEYLFSIEGYYRTMENIYEFKEILKYDRSLSIETLFTEGEGEAYGVEFFINKRAGNFTGWIGYTLSWTRRLFDKLNTARIFYPRYDRRHDVSLVLAYRFSNKFSVGLTWAYASGQGYTMPTAQYSFTPLGVKGDRDERTQFNYTRRNEYKLPAYHKMDLSFNYKFKMLEYSAEAYLTLYNLYNRQNSFAHYVAYNYDETTGEKYAQIKQITLMPFIPTFGVSIKF